MLRESSTIDTVVIHHADTPDGVPFTAVDIEEWHQVRGFRRDPGDIPPGKRGDCRFWHIGYHKVIHVDGLVVDGRDLVEVGAHCKNHNQRSVGVCLIGRRRFSPRQWHALASVVESYLRELGRLRIAGHRDLTGGDRDCPGFDVKKWLSAGMQPAQDNILEGS